MTRIQFVMQGEVHVDAERLGIVAANGIGSDNSIESQVGVMDVRLDPTKAFGAWLSGLVFEKFYETFPGGETRIILGQVHAYVMDPEPGAED